MNSTVAVITAMSISGILLAATAYVSYRHAKSEIKRMEHLARWRNEFFDSVLPLLNDDETPVAIIEAIKGASRIIDERKCAYYLFEAVRKGTEQGADKAPYSKFFERRPELRESLNAFLHSFVLAVSFSDAKIGREIRSAYAELLADRNKGRTIARTVSIIRSAESHQPDLCLTAT